MLGDAVYAPHTTCKAVMDWGLSVLFTCTDESPPWIAEQVPWGEPETRRMTEWHGNSHLEHRYRWIKGIEHRAEGEKLLVKYRYFATYNREQGNMGYQNSGITDNLVSTEHGRLLATGARARWKIANEHNTVLKHDGYHLEHTFGHGENHACQLYGILNLLAFLVHGVLLRCDETCIKGRSYFGRRGEFYHALRTFFWAFEFQSWDDFLLFVITHARGG